MIADWNKIILDAQSAEQAWEQIFIQLKEMGTQSTSPVTLHDQTVVPDRLLSEAAWELWNAYPENAIHTSRRLKEWATSASSGGTAVLVLDALSLRELPYLIGGAQSHDIPICNISITGAECPSTTDQFAKALGLSSRSSLANDKKPGTFSFFGKSASFTDVVSLPFEDCPVSSSSNLFIWHTWLDDLIHLQNRLPDQISHRQHCRAKGSGDSLTNCAKEEGL
jgi:hypothetical protein